MGLSAEVKRSLQVLLGGGGATAFRYTTSPAMGGAGIAGVQLTTGAGAYGAYADLVAAGAITTEFWVAGLSAYTAAAAQVFQIQVRNATLTRILADFEADVTAVTLNLPTMFLPFPVYCAGSTQVDARAGGAAAKTINVRLHYALAL